jgi:hypothetical protein
LPDGRVLSFGGQYSGPSPAPVATTNAGTILYCTRVTDLYDVTSNSWRQLANMNRFIHYHNVTVLVPDGRVIATGGAGLTSNRSFAGDDSSIEAFEPPYLFRGVRPRIDSLSTTEMVVGSNFTFKVSFASALTRVVLVSARATSHWVDGGPQRLLSLAFTQTGQEVQAAIPNDAARALAGYYILFAMVDDVPSVGKIVRITPATTPRPGWPGVSISSADNAASEPGSNVASFTVTRSGATTAPLLVNYSVSGTAVNGSDYNTISNFALIPAGASSTTVTLTPIDDAWAEGPESIMVSVADTSFYNAGASTNVSLTLADNEPAPVPLKLQLISASNNQYVLTVLGPTTRVVEIETSNDLVTWQGLSSMINASGTNRLYERIEDSGGLFFRARLALE